MRKNTSSSKLPRILVTGISAAAIAFAGMAGTAYAATPTAAAKPGPFQDAVMAGAPAMQWGTGSAAPGQYEGGEYEG
jgi:hypothetical protein